MVQTGKDAELAAAVLSGVLATVLLGIAIGLVLYARSHRDPRLKADAAKELLDNFELDSDAESERGGGDADNGVAGLTSIELAAGPMREELSE